MVQYLENLFPHAGPQTMVDAGHGVQPNEADPIDHRSHHIHRPTPQSSPDDAQHQSGNSQGATCDVGDHIHDLLALGIIRQPPVNQLDSLSHATHHPKNPSPVSWHDFTIILYHTLPQPERPHRRSATFTFLY